MLDQRKPYSCLLHGHRSASDILRGSDACLFPVVPFRAADESTDGLDYCRLNWNLMLRSLRLQLRLCGAQLLRQLLAEESIVLCQGCGYCITDDDEFFKRALCGQLRPRVEQIKRAQPATVPDH